ncbi:glycerophosphoryl diester phosphodiesterase [Westerdykella ornata]|uniref:glycerophosphodiester phosphodiesterase n=1 Tax=Westerdykella ornata TaxID=318751 RepID=A0A6A6JL28_WESOR|nr:glycerophosphoryl diester phosphodiesterase [Westerdykella ornata]KAF2276813.1 glycerophosphoryl diester phosphodiesterase [Westerdykella ornata]
MRSLLTSTLLISIATGAVVPKDPGHGQGQNKKLNVQVGPRPYFLVEDMDEGPLKKKLQSCSEGPFKVSNFSISHRGAPLQFPEHTRESYSAARREGAGIIECDVAFTKDKKLVCRHAQCDLHTTTDILARPNLAAKCTTPFTPARNGTPAQAKCCTSDITLAEFKTLCGKMDGYNANGTTVAEYMAGTPPYRTDLYATCGTVMAHDEYLKLVDGWGLKFTPELKTPEVEMPFDGYTQEQYAQDLVNAYKKAGIKPERVFLQSFLPADIFYWIKNEPAFGQQAVYLDERVDTPEGYANATASIPDLAKKGVRILAPAFFALTKLDSNRNIVPSEYAIAAKKAGIKLIGWSFERSGFLKTGGGYYYDYVKEVINNDGDMYTVLHALAQQVGVMGMFSDWPATVTYYASCFGL